jgi:2-dehydropantoate 2-reductase
LPHPELVALECADLRNIAFDYVFLQHDKTPFGLFCRLADTIAGRPQAILSEAIRVGQAHGYQLEEILHLAPETIALAGEGDETAMHACDEQRFKDGKRTASEQRPSMGQDMVKGRRTEIEFLNGFVGREGEKVGLSCRANAVLTDIVKRVERGELKPDPRHITELRLN